MSSAYISALNRSLITEIQSGQISKPDLHQRFLDWFGSVPEISRIRPYSMVELERALNTQGRYLSPVLLNLGWRRHRKWSSHAHYLRYWLPPIS